jgi:hypothetical protein
LFGTITGLVGTFFGVKTSADARQGARELANNALAGDTAPPRVVLTNPPDNAEDVPPGFQLAAIFSKDMDPTTLSPNTFKLLKQDGSALLMAVKLRCTR